MTDNIKPEHYRTGEIDLYEAWYRTYPFNEYRAIMQAVAERYMRRDKNNRVEDLKKAVYTIERLKEKEIEHSGGSENKFEKISKVISNKKIKIAGFYQEKAYIKKERLLKELHESGYGYLARSRYGTLVAYEVKVQRCNRSWGTWNDDYEVIENDNFPEVKWADDEPTKIADLLATYENSGESGK